VVVQGGEGFREAGAGSSASSAVTSTRRVGDTVEMQDHRLADRGCYQGIEGCRRAEKREREGRSPGPGDIDGLL
jgi:hypothetical protein